MFKFTVILFVVMTLSEVFSFPQQQSLDQQNYQQQQAFQQPRNSQQQQQQQYSNSPAIPIVSQTQTLDGSGNFNYAFETADGIREEGSGQLKSLRVPQVDPSTGQVVGETEGQGIVQQGRYSYTAPDGQQIEVTYIADENGFQPQGAHLPVPPAPQV